MQCTPRVFSCLWGMYIEHCCDHKAHSELLHCQQEVSCPEKYKHTQVCTRLAASRITQACFHGVSMPAGVGAKKQYCSSYAAALYNS